MKAVSAGDLTKAREVEKSKAWETIPATYENADSVFKEKQYSAATELFERYRHRLRLMVRLRLDRRLSGRLDPSDVLQEAYLDMARRFDEYAARRANSA